MHVHVYHILSTRSVVLYIHGEGVMINNQATASMVSCSTLTMKAGDSVPVRSVYIFVDIYITIHASTTLNNELKDTHVIHEQQILLP